MRVMYSGSLRPFRRWYVAAAAGAALGAAAAAQPPTPPLGEPRPVAGGAKPDTAVAVPTSLAECIAVALERQPNVRAARASLSAALAGQNALAKLHPWTTALAPELPVRREQAARGITVATAEVQKTESEAVYDVTYTYYGYIYARQQEQTATDVIEQMDVFYQIAKRLLEAGPPDPRTNVNQFTVYAMQEAIDEVKLLRVDARTGQETALAALKEAMGVELNTPIVPRDKELPIMGGSVTRDDVVAHALARRPEIAQAAAGVDAFRLEICAQDKKRFSRTVPTLAAGTDLHARYVPAPMRNGEYRPGALAPEMPTTLVGRREDRVARAYELSQRQDELFAKTRELVGLEATNAYLNWKSSAEKIAIAKERYQRAQRAADLGRREAANANVGYDLLVRNEALAGRAQANYLSAVFDHIKALARLQRVTAGGVAPAFPGGPGAVSENGNGK